MTSDLLATTSGAVLSLLFSYIPGLSGWYEKLDGTYKRLVMLAALVLTTGACFSLACSGWGAEYGLQVTCDRKSLAGLLQALLLAIMANQSIYSLKPQ